jgi:hypothetical protein
MKALCYSMGIVFLVSAPVHAQPDSGNLVPSKIWKAADAWKIAVQIFSREDARTGSFNLHVGIVGVEEVDSASCWKVFFIPERQKPDGVGNSYCVMVEKETGWPRKVIRVRDPSSAAIEKFKEGAWVSGAPQGFPLEIFPLIGPNELKSRDHHSILTLDKKVEGSQITLEAKFKSGNGEAVVRQKWVEGEKWWRHYERYVNGRKDLEAHREDVPANTTIAANKNDKSQPTVGKAAGTSHSEPDPWYLRRDPKLQVKLPMEVTRPSVQELLERIERATNLKLTLAKNLEKHQPDFGEFQMRLAYAFNVMEIMEKKDLTDGHWVKTTDGYRLEGKSNIVVEEGATVSPAIWFARGAVVIVVASCAFFYLRRNRGVKNLKPSKVAAKAHR